ncbi:hypothetical protein ASPWEDRAFT_102340 [Aspergillus wentii DTO 134E9]|uniref:Uncharacterized protein n=1 Tax=Aspergillus wentii DTO 134E9 TaxID=1073089 RepID=A0A1L9RYW6_ASPWE|nr:uncharacterized protein ASPWEDRAFT_102340 [Aspergillus wentii DTO 134E9]OJJ40008.1 hypothetical protein ASPWEDRAFT_102340 [Aspergillus wentii DTO 134E9]
MSHTSSTFQPPQVAQSQEKPGLETHMTPPSEITRLDAGNELVEYTASGKLKDKKVFITGGDSGIGRSVAVLMAKEGADISIVYLPEEQEDAEETKKMVKQEGRECLLLPGDLRNRSFCKEAVEEHIKQFGRINVLVNNAAKQYRCKDFVDIDLDEVEDTFQTNIIQIFAVTKFALPYMARGDSIINNTSVSAFRGSSSVVDYAATKGAIVGFTRSLAVQLMPKGIRVNAVAPGGIYTPFQVATREASEMENWGSHYGLGRPGQASEVATSFVFLASADSSFYYGQVLHCYPLGD